MTSNEPGTPAAAVGDAKPNAPQGNEQASLGNRITQAGREKSAQIAEQAKTAARDLSGKARAAATQKRKRSWGAVTAAVAAGAGIMVGWLSGGGAAGRTAAAGPGCGASGDAGRTP
jgi:hypothetical protein